MKLVPRFPWEGYIVLCLVWIVVVAIAGYVYDWVLVGPQ